MLDPHITSSAYPKITLIRKKQFEKSAMHILQMKDRPGPKLTGNSSVYRILVKDIFRSYDG